MKKTMYFLILIFITSCSNNSEPTFVNEDQVRSSSIESKGYLTDSIVLLNSEGVPLSIKVDNRTKTYTMEEFDNEMNLFASKTSSEVITCVGYTSKVKISSYVTTFTGPPADPRFQMYVYYVADRYRYIYKITIPQGAELITPVSVSATWPMGFTTETGAQYGYLKFGPISSSAKGDTYELHTFISEISYNTSGQYLGFTGYLPFRVGNPSTDLIFKYQWISVDWG